GLALELRPLLRGEMLDELLDLLLRLRERARGQRLEDDGAGARRLQPALDVERHGGRREREQAITRRSLQLLPPEEDVTQSHQAPGSISLWPPAPATSA